MRKGIEVTGALLVLLLTAGPLVAQGNAAAGSGEEPVTGTVTGRVMADAGDRPIHLAAVAVMDRAGAVVARTGTNQLGHYRLEVPPGTYDVRIAAGLDHAGGGARDVRVAQGETVEVDIRVPLQPLALAEVSTPVTSSSRSVNHRLIEAPAAVSVVGHQRIREQPAANPLHRLSTVPVDVADNGIQSGTVVGRGFNNIFSGSLQMLHDHRAAGVPSLRVNFMHFVPSTSEDLERIELVRGPASALYGPNTRDGVLHLITRSPFDDPGTTASLSAGERDLLQGSVSTSHRLSDRLAVRAAGEYFGATEWEYHDPEEVVARDTRVRRGSGDLRLDWRIDAQTDAIFSAGRTTAGNGIELTGVGAAQVRDWSYTYYQARVSRDRLFAQAYLNASDAGETSTLRTDLPIVDRSRLFSAQVQHGFDLGSRQRYTYGVDYFRTMPDTDGTIHGRHEDHDDYDEVGAFLQLETSLEPRWNLILAGRADHHSELEDPVFSPRAALLFRPTETHGVRLTYNRAFSTPTAVNLFLDLDAGGAPDPALGALGYGLWAQGTGRDGFSFRHEDGSLTGMRSPFNPGGAHQLLPANAATLWGLAVGALQAQGAVDAQTASFLMQQSPSGQQVGLAYLDAAAASAGVRPLTDEVNLSFSPVRESHTSTWEIGYRGVLGRGLLFSADLWHAKHSNFVSELRPVTPLLFLEGESLGGYAAAPLVGHFMERGMGLDDAQAAAGQLLTAMGSVPLGVLASEESGSRAGRSDLLVTFRNFGEVSLSGLDLEARYDLGTGAYGGGTLSWVDRDHFETEGEVVALNAPALKWALFGGHRDLDRGWNGEVRVRRTAGFPILSAPYQATACIDPEDPGAEPCVQAATLVDLVAGYDLPMMPAASLQLGVTNLFDSAHRGFAGVPEIGRMAIARVRFRF